jgi:hypothetical protein
MHGFEPVRERFRHLRNRVLRFGSRCSEFPQESDLFPALRAILQVSRDAPVRIGRFRYETAQVRLVRMKRMGMGLDQAENDAKRVQLRSTVRAFAQMPFHCNAGILIKPVLEIAEQQTGFTAGAASPSLPCHGLPSSSGSSPA